MPTTYQGLTPEQRRKQYLRDRAMIKKAKETQIAFLGSNLRIRMGVTTIGGCTGLGKSTTSANLLAYFYKTYPERQALIITNEEVSADVLDRVACILLGYNFYHYRDGFFDASIEEKINELSLKLMNRIEVVASQEVDMTCLEDVKDVLTNASNRPDVQLVLVDYLQTVTWSKEYQHLNAYEVSKQLGFFLKEYGRSVTIPVVVFAQMQPGSKDPKMSGDFATRIQGDKTFVNHSIMAIEIIPEFDSKTTKFVIHKDRFSGKQGQSLTFEYKMGFLEEVEKVGHEE